MSTEGTMLVLNRQADVRLSDIRRFRARMYQAKQRPPYTLIVTHEQAEALYVQAINELLWVDPSGDGLSVEGVRLLPLADYEP